MKHSMSGFKLGLCALALGFSGWANALCYIGGETNAASVQGDSGNGTYSCGDTLSPLTGKGLKDITALLPAGSIKPGSTIPGTIQWSVPVVDGKAYNVELVSVASNSGKRCNYAYPDLATSGDNLSTTVEGDTSRKTLTICATTDNPVPFELQAPPEPFNSTAVNGCDATFSNAGNGTFDVAIGYSKQQDGGQYEGVAICAREGSGQKRCINECVPRDYSACNPDDPSLLLPPGTLPLSCAQCEWEPPEAVKVELKDPDIKYCWYHENRVDEPAGTFKPSPKKKSLSLNIDVISGSNCYLKTVGPLYGGKTYSYWYCPPVQ